MCPSSSLPTSKQFTDSYTIRSQLENAGWFCAFQKQFLLYTRYEAYLQLMIMGTVIPPYSSRNLLPDLDIESFGRTNMDNSC